MNVLEADLLPEELKEWFEKYNSIAVRMRALGGPDAPNTQIKPVQIHFFHKSDLSRIEGWLACLKRSGLREGQKNPWRKHHSENYWCWVLDES